jgi:choice-of-anchor C domain-containing protein
MNSWRTSLNSSQRPLGLAVALIIASLTLLAWPRAAQAAGTWTETGPLANARYYHTATLLADGRVLVAGGADDGGYLDSAELFDPATGSWASPGSLVPARGAHTATLLADGRVLVAGGVGGAGNHLASVELFNPATGTWSSANSLGTARAGHTATLLADGRVLVAGGVSSAGNYLASAELFNPATGAWAPTTGPPATARASHTATLLADGRVLVAGGSNSTDGYLASAELFYPGTGTWATPGPLATGRTGHTATLLADGRILVAGGDNSTDGRLASAQLFNPATNLWSGAGPLATARYFHTATRLADGRVLVAGGTGSAGNQLASAELFNPATETWSSADSLAVTRNRQTATLLLDGRVLVAGGFIGFGYGARAELYDPQNLLRNGSFETAGVDPGAGTVGLPVGSDSINRWVVGDAGIDYRGGYWQPAEGRRSLDLNGALGPGSIRQAILISPGKRYLVTFALAGNPLGGDAVKTLRVSAAGQSRDFTFDTTGKTTNNMGWTTKSWTFTANDVATTLQFQSLTTGGYGPALDKVRVIRAALLPQLLPLLLD